MSDPKSSAKDLLLADHKYLCDSFWKNEEVGEKRVHFFIMLVTAVLAASATLLAKSPELCHPRDVIGMVVFALAALLIFGWITLLRILKRNEVTDGYKRDLTAIRRRFQSYFDDAGILKDYQPFGPRTDDMSFAPRKLGGLTHTVAAMNGIILAAGVGAVCAAEPPLLISASAVFIFALSFAAQFCYIRQAEGKETGRFHVTHAGAIVWKMIDARPQFLLVTAKTNPDHWVFPKGHIEKGERAAQTAIRELAEEAGVRAVIWKAVDPLKYRTDKEVVRAKFYLMKYLDDSIKPSTEKRQTRWCDFAEAHNLLTFENTRLLLLQARRLLTASYESNRT